MQGCNVKVLYKVPVSLPPQPLTLFIIIIKHSFALLTNWKALAGGHKGGRQGYNECKCQVFKLDNVQFATQAICTISKPNVMVPDRSTMAIQRE